MAKTRLSLWSLYSNRGGETRGRKKPALVMNFQKIIRMVEKNKAGMVLDGDGGMEKQEKRAWRGRKKKSSHKTKPRHRSQKSR